MRLIHDSFDARPMTRFRSTCAALLLAFASSACGNILDTAPADERSIVSDEAMRLVLSRTTVTEGTPLPMTVTLSNTTGRPITYEANTCPYNVYEVEDAAGQRIDPRIELILCAAYTQIVTLAPGASKTWSVEWNASRFAPERSARPNGPQQVRIRARYWIDGKTEIAGSWQGVTVNQAP